MLGMQKPIYIRITLFAACHMRKKIEMVLQLHSFLFRVCLSVCLAFGLLFALIFHLPSLISYIAYCMPQSVFALPQMSHESSANAIKVLFQAYFSFFRLWKLK